MQCSKCHQDAIVFQSCSGLHLCARHLIADVEAKAKKMIRAHQWLIYGDHIAVDLSYDKSSAALLYFLKKLTAERRDIKISAIAINDGTKRHESPSSMGRIAGMPGTECFTGSWQRESVAGEDTAVQKAGETPASHSSHADRFLMLERIARQHGITKIARAVTLDDAAGAVLESIMRGDVERLDNKPGIEAIPRICPFISVPAAEVSLYADIYAPGDEHRANPEQGDGLHRDVNIMLDVFTANHPATKYALLNLGTELAGSPSGIAGLIHACERYGTLRQGICDDGAINGEVQDGAY